MVDKHNTDKLKAEYVAEDHEEIYEETEDGMYIKGELKDREVVFE